MTDIETEKFRQIGIDLINEYRQQRGIRPIQFLDTRTPEINALIRSIQLHEKTKKELQDVKQELADFRQEVSDAVGDTLFMVETHCDGEAVALVSNRLMRFIIHEPKPDPLVDVLLEMELSSDLQEGQHDAKEIRAALEARGLEIREKNDG